MDPNDGGFFVNVRCDDSDAGVAHEPDLLRLRKMIGDQAFERLQRSRETSDRRRRRETEIDDPERVAIREALAFGKALYDRRDRQPSSLA